MKGWENDASFADRVAELCYNHYENLGKKGKPQAGREWTLVAAVVCVDEKAGTLYIVSMGTGSKCLGQSKMSPRGDVLNDSHAEIVARRGLVRYLYNQVQYAYTGQPSCFIYKEEDHMCHLEEGVSFHLFTSHTPCGDASIFPKGDDNVFVGTPSDERHHTFISDKNSYKRQNAALCPLDAGSPAKKLCMISQQKIRSDTSVEMDQHENICKSVNTSSNQGSEEFAVDQKNSHGNTCVPYETYAPQSQYISQSGCCTLPDDKVAPACRGDDRDLIKDIYRTGAKCVPGGEQDLRQSGAGYHTVGVLRTKPGRGDPTLSMSCSDKILKWNILGCQGALLSYFLASPIFFSSLITGKCPFDLCASERAFYRRAEQFEASFMVHKPKVLNSKKEFKSSKAKLESLVATSEGSGKVSPSSSSIIWIKDPLVHEVSVNGIKQGVTKANLMTLKARLCICKSSLFDTFKSLISTITDEKLPLPLRQREAMTYAEHKRGAMKYNRARQQFLSLFPTWIVGPSSLNNFM